MSKREHTFVCSTIVNGELISLSFSAENKEQAEKSFFERYGVAPQQILGPFRKIKETVFFPSPKKELQFLGCSPIKGIFDGWKVSAFPLKYPIDHAYLIFHGRLDGIAKPLPKGTIIVPQSEIK